MNYNFSEFKTTYAVKLIGNESHINFINTLPCEVNLKFTQNLNETTIPSFDNVLFQRVEAAQYSMEIVPNSSIKACSTLRTGKFVFEAVALKVTFVR
jgi:hypothetical protein